MKIKITQKTKLTRKVLKEAGASQDIIKWIIKEKLDGYTFIKLIEKIYSNKDHRHNFSIFENIKIDKNVLKTLSKSESIFIKVAVAKQDSWAIQYIDNPADVVEDYCNKK